LAERGSVLATGASERYGYHLLNLLGSVKTNSRVFERIVAFDLGLGPRQRALLDDVHGVEVRTVPAFVPHWREGRTWKTWVWTHVEAERLVWLDAGLTVLRPLEGMLASIDARDYFAVSQGHPIADSIPSDYYELYGFPHEYADRVAIAAGIFGFRVGSDFYERVIVPTFEDACRGLSTGFSPEEEAGLNRGLDRNPQAPARGCKHFRWDQTILNLRFHLGVEEPVVHDLDEYAGWRSPHDHPRQVIWSHRRQGDMAYLARAPATLRGKAFGLRYRVRWWFRMRRKYFSATTYVLKARKLRRSLHREPP
jgi:hypothetical protein